MNRRNPSTLKKRITLSLLGLCIAAALSSCSSVPANQQWMLARNSMQVAETGTAPSSYVSKMSADIEPGISEGGSVATSCSSCR